MKVVPTADGKEDTSKAVESDAITVGSYDEAVFAFKKIRQTAVQQSALTMTTGTLKDDAIVLYLTEETKKTMKFDVKGSSGYVSCTGLVEILDAYSDGYDSRPLNIRIIGKVTADGVVGANSDTNNLNLKTNNTKRIVKNITIEGMRDDAVCYGFGIRDLNTEC